MSGLFAPGRLRAAERIAVGIYVLAAVFVMGRDVAGRVVQAAVPATSSVATATAQPTAETTALAATASPAATAVPTASPRATPDPLVATAYRSGGRRYAALTVPVGYTLTSPIGGTVRVVVYQLLGGDVRVGSNVPSEPFYPYVTITSAERRVILRPGALGRDVRLIVTDGQPVDAGAPLFTIAGDGASSWRAFYDRSVTAQVIASVASLPSGAELDPLPLFRR